MLAEHLVKCGHDCVCAINERNGLSLIQKENFDVVLLDLKNKEFSGYDVIDSLEKNGKLKENKIVVYTTLNLSQLEIEGLLKRGVYSYLQKPVKCIFRIGDCDSFTSIKINIKFYPCLTQTNYFITSQTKGQ